MDLAKKIEAPVIAVLNKVDWLDEKPKLLDLIEKYRPLHDFAAYIPISAKTGDGLDVLRQEIIERLPNGPAPYPDDYLTDQPQRFLAAEVLREKVLHHTQQEVPHAVAVVIETWEDTPKLLRIAATIYVEKAGAEGHPHRGWRRGTQKDRHAGAQGTGASVRSQSFPADFRQGSRRLAPGSRISCQRWTGARIRKWQNCNAPYVACFSCSC